MRYNHLAGRIPTVNNRKSLATGTVKFHRTDLTRNMTKKHNLYEECYKILLSNTKEDLNNWRDTL